MGTEANAERQKFGSMAEFYPFYLSEHSNRTSRRLHFAGTSLGLVFLAAAIVTLNGWFVLAGLVCGYAFAWVGHFFFEKNRPATFSYPFYSFAGDWVMWSEILRGKIKF
jgi:hypothetical protein